MKVLLLGGTGEARRLAELLVAEPGVSVVSSLAGRTVEARLPEGTVRSGGFGGVEGLTAWIKANNIQVVVDATHPFAATMTEHAVEAARNAQVELLVLRRAGWREQSGDRWTWVDSVEEAARVVPELGSRAFLTIGRQGLDAFASVSERSAGEASKRNGGECSRGAGEASERDGGGCGRGVGGAGERDGGGCGRGVGGAGKRDGGECGCGVGGAGERNGGEFDGRSGGAGERDGGDCRHGAGEARERNGGECGREAGKRDGGKCGRGAGEAGKRDGGECGRGAGEASERDGGDFGRGVGEATGGERQGVWVLARCVDPPEPVPTWCELLLDRGPYGVQDELELLRDRRIDVLVTKDSGGSMTKAKLKAARELGIPVVVIRRAAPPVGVAVVETVDQVVEWVQGRR